MFCRWLTISECSVWVEITAEGCANLQLGCLVITEAGGRTGILFVVNPDIWVTDWLQVSSGNEAALYFGCWLTTSKNGVWGVDWVGTTAEEHATWHPGCM